MTSAITTSLPSGPLQSWCIQALPLSAPSSSSSFSSLDSGTWSDPLVGSAGLGGCANTANATNPDDFQTICCNGWITYKSGPRSELFGPVFLTANASSSNGNINGSNNVWGWAYDNATIDRFGCFFNPMILINTPIASPTSDPSSACASASLPPLPNYPQVPSVSSACISGSTTPIASLAATNTKNAESIFQLSFRTSGGTAIYAAAPTCLWINTAHGQAMAQVTAPAYKAVRTTAVDAPAPSNGGLRLPRGVRVEVALAFAVLNLVAIL